MSEVEGELLTSADAAVLLGVSASTIKRWVDEGELPAERTAGGHRRIRRAALERLRLRLRAPEAGAAQLVDLLLGDGPAQRIEARLLELRADAGSAVGLAAQVAAALVELGERWDAGKISIVDEHLASERLARALARLVEWTPLADGAPRALLALATGEEHSLGLSLLELVLREAGWRTLWAGRKTPAAELARTVADADPAVRLVALSASVVSRDRKLLAADERTVGAACARAGATLLVGGAGAWPDEPRHARLIRDFGEADAFVRELGRRLEGPR